MSRVYFVGSPPAIPEGVTLYSELPTKDWIPFPTLHMIYQTDDMTYIIREKLTALDYGHRELIFLDVVLFRHVVRALSEYVDSPELYDLYRKICLWIPN